MTEKEVLEKLDFFKKAIISLKEEKEDLESQLFKANSWIEEYNSKASSNKEEEFEFDKLKEEHERCESAFAKLSKMYSQKYSESDLKNLLKKASEKSKQKIEELKKSNDNWEKEYFKLKELYDNLEISNKSLERKISEKNIEEEIDKVLKGEPTSKEMEATLDEKKERRIIGV